MLLFLNGYGIGIIVGCLSCVVSLILYVNLWKKNKHVLPDRRLWNSLSYVFSYIPGQPPAKHIVTGLLASIGLSASFGYSYGAIFGRADYDFHSTAITVTSFILAILMAIIAIWTLYQTKKIEYQQGYKIDSFQTLIEKMNHELDSLYKSYTKEFKHKAQNFHKVFIITDHPFFGLMSYPDDEFTRTLKHHFDDLRELKNRGYDFPFEIICGNKECIKKFVTDYFGQEFEEKIRVAVEDFERHIEPYEEKGIATRVGDVPSFPQFAIIGNTIFEFILVAKKPRTELMTTNVIFDRERSKLYEETFNLLKQKLSN